MELRDISVALRPGTPEWPGDTPYDCRWTAKITHGDSVNVSAISGSPHVGTHADAPLHVTDGAAAADALPLTAFIGPARVVDVRRATGELELEDLGIPPGQGIERLLLRTGCSIADGAFPAVWPVVSERCVATLLERGLQLLGVDAPSVDARESKELRVHHRLFDGSAYVLENLDLRDVEPGTYELTAAPIKLAGLDAAPVRAVLGRRAAP
jgi:arylformamidase